MVKYKNLTGRLVSFSIPVNDTIRWITIQNNETVEISDIDNWRAKAFGLTKEEPAKKPIEPVKPVVVKKKKK